MSPERQAIIKAISCGYCTPKAISKYIGRPPQTISKLLYVMSHQGLLQKARYGIYSLKGSIEGSTRNPSRDGFIESSVDISVESSIAFQLSELKVQGDKLESQVQTLTNDLEKNWEQIEVRLEQWWLEKSQEEGNLQEQIKRLETQVEQLQTANQEKQNLIDSQIANDQKQKEVMEQLQTENRALQEQVERLKTVIEETPSENEARYQPLQPEVQKPLEPRPTPNAVVETRPSENQALPKPPTELPELSSKPAQSNVQTVQRTESQVLATYRAQIQQKRTELEGKKLESPRWEKLAQFVLELEEIEKPRE